MRRRRVLLALTCAPTLGAGRIAAAEEGSTIPWSVLGSGPIIVLMRHANAPGVGDPPPFTLGRCETQRNLDDSGRRQARAFGASFRRQAGPPAAVWSSQWCRCLDTAREAFGAVVQEQAAFNSFFAERDQAEAQTEAARGLLRGWRGPGVLVVVTHQVNITALTGIFPASGEAWVLRAEGARLAVLGRLPPD